MEAPRGDVTQLLAQWAGGNPTALDALMPIVYRELRQMAETYLRRERGGHTLQPTALVHEAWIRLVDQANPSFDHRKQFFALASQAMRRILVDHARAAQADKRGGGWIKTSLESTPAAANTPAADSLVDVLALNRALDQLAQVSERQVRIIELRYFSGLKVEEIAALLDVSPATVSRDQRVAEAWLGHAITEGPA